MARASFLVKYFVRFKFSKWHVRHCWTQLGIGTLRGKRKHKIIRLSADKHGHWKHANTKELDQAQTNTHVGNTKESVCWALRENTWEFDRVQTNTRNGTWPSTAKHVMIAKNIRAHALARRKSVRKIFWFWNILIKEKNDSCQVEIFWRRRSVKNCASPCMLRNSCILTWSW